LAKNYWDRWGLKNQKASFCHRKVYLEAVFSPPFYSVGWKCQAMLMITFRTSLSLLSHIDTDCETDLVVLVFIGSCG